MWTRFFDGSVDLRAIGLALLATLAAAWISARIARQLTTAGLRAVVHDTMSASSPHVRRVLRIVGWRLSFS